MPDLMEKQSGGKQPAVPLARFSSKYFFPNHQYPQNKFSLKQITPAPTAQPRALFKSTSLSQQTIQPQTGVALLNFTLAAKERVSSLIFILEALFSTKSAIHRRQCLVALKQLKHLAALCSTTSSFTNEEAIAFDAAFGEAYYSVLQLAKNPSKKPNEHEIHLHSSFKSLLRSVDSV